MNAPAVVDTGKPHSHYRHDQEIGAANAAGGVHGRQVTYDWRDDESDPLANLTAARDLVDDDHVPFEIGTEAHREFLTAMREYSPHLDPAADHVALTGWIVTDMALVGLDRAGPCPNRAEFMAALRAVDDYDANGLLAAPVDLEAGFGQLTTCFSFVRVTPDGSAFEVVGPLPYCGGQPAPAGVATIAPTG